MEQRFAGRRIVITGAGGGLGFAYAERLAREGATVVIAEIDAALGRQAEASLRSAGLDAVFIATDVTSEASLEAMAAAAGPDIHGVVCNASWANNVGGRTYRELDIEAWDRMMTVNVRGTWLTVRAVAPRMRDGGSIVTIGSDGMLWGAPKLLHYVTSKSAMIGMTRSLARELGERAIRVNCLMPGLTVVEATKDVPEQRWNDYAQRQLIKRKQHPDDLDGVIAFLMSEDSKFMTGQMLVVDGGFAMY
jgi:NAD(P)-dependent dehydrogenase (short-subunit alcohol dehydrogenase family)